MKKTAITLFVVLGMTLTIALAPTLTWAAEYSYAGPPAFTITYPDGSQPNPKADKGQVWRIKTPEGVDIQAIVGVIPEGIELKDYAEKGFKPGLEASQKTTAKMKSNKEYELADGTKAYYSEIEWMWQGSTLITTVMIAAYKDGKLVYVAAYPWADPDEPIEVVQSLKFK
jgi:hypothetical protein